MLVGFFVHMDLDNEILFKNKLVVPSVYEMRGDEEIMLE